MSDDLKNGACTVAGMVVGGAVVAGGVTAPLAITAGMATAMGCALLLNENGVKTDGVNIPSGIDKSAPVVSAKPKNETIER